MKSKKVTYILIALVILIWGVIIVRVFKQFKSPNEIDAGYIAIPPATNYFKKDSVYKLSLDYSDPFLKGSYTNAKSNSKPSKSPVRQSRNIRQRIAPQEKKKEQIVWPRIKFSGIIENDKSKQQLGLILIETESYLLNSGDTRKDVTIKKIFVDSIQVSFKNELKTISKSN